MAINQSKGLGHDARPQAATASVSAVRNQAAGHDRPPAGEFAALLASADMPVQSPTTEPGSAPAQHARPADGPRGPAAERERQARGPQSMDKDASNASEDVEPPNVRKPAKQDKSVEDNAALPPPVEQVGRDAIALQATPLLAADLALAAESAQTPAPEEVPANPVLSPMVVGGGHGAQRTSQLQQSLAANLGKQGASAALAAGMGAHLPDVADSSENTAALAPPTLGVHELRSLVSGRVQGADGVMESGARVMDLMASVASQAGLGSGYGSGTGAESRGQDAGRGGTGLVQDAWHVEPTDIAGQAPAEFNLEDAPVQETVRYWVGADSRQQAQLSVADVAGGNVDVTIHMQGKEAQVSFRADEQLAREALQAGSSQLKNLLGQEGLTLSGLSVGTSLGGQEGGQEPRPGSGQGKTAKVAPAGDEVVVTLVRGNAPGMTGGRGGKLDLFV